MKMMIKKTVTAGILLLLILFGCAPKKQVQTEKVSKVSGKPNIIFILADDLGYGDLAGYYGGKAHTPNLNKLAQEGMLFTDFHSNGPMCSPTRAALMTGRYPQRLGIEDALSTDWTDEGIGSKVNSNEKTIAHYLKEVGYETAIYGKWHLGKAPVANPVRYGFNEFRGLTCGSGDYFSKMDRNGYRDWWHNENLEFQEGYATHVITDNAVQFIEKNNDQPFFLYVAYSAIHFPWQRAEDHNLEIVREGEDYTSIQPGPKSKLGPHQPEMIPSVLINMIEELDQGVGKIMEGIRKSGLAENTLVFFTSDNGSYLQYSEDLWPSVGSNGPLRGQKGMLYEGGHRVPAIAWWPGKIPALSVSDETAMTFDLLPTVMDLLNVPVPTAGSKNVLDGKSILPLLTKEDALTDRTLYWKIEDLKAVREGKWKLIVNENNSSELYNLDNDIGEHIDLSSKNPDVVSALTTKLMAWEADVDTN